MSGDKSVNLTRQLSTACKGEFKIPDTTELDKYHSFLIIIPGIGGGFLGDSTFKDRKGGDFEATLSVMKIYLLNIAVGKYHTQDKDPKRTLTHFLTLPTPEEKLDKLTNIIDCLNRIAPEKKINIIGYSEGGCVVLNYIVKLLMHSTGALESKKIDKVLVISPSSECGDLQWPTILMRSLKPFNLVEELLILMKIISYCQ